MSFVFEFDSIAHHATSEAATMTKATSAWKEARLLIGLTLPTIIIQLGGVLPPFLIASFVGRTYGSVYLGAFTLASLTGNLFSLSLLQGIFSASDTLSPQAFGANNFREVGLIAMRGYVAALLVVVPINIVLFFFLDTIMRAVGEDAEVAYHAWRWYQIFVFSLPFYALYQVIWKFLSAQEIMGPLVGAVLFSSVVILPLALYALPAMAGFLGTALALLTFFVFQSVSLLVYLKWKTPHIPATWPGLGTWSEALNGEKFLAFMALGAGGMLASSEWIYWETLSLMIGTMGVVELSIHTIPTQVIMCGYMVPLSIAIALAIRLGSTMPRCVERAKNLAVVCSLVSYVIIIVMSVFGYTQRHSIYSLFTTEQDVIEGAERIWWKVCWHFFNLSIFCINMGIATGLGMQWTLGVTAIFFLWVLGLPAAYYVAILQGGGLDAAWSLVWPPYVAMNAILMTSFYFKDWDEIAAEIRLREGMEKAELATLLLKRHDTIETNGSVYGSAGSIEPEVTEV